MFDLRKNTNKWVFLSEICLTQTDDKKTESEIIAFFQLGNYRHASKINFKNQRIPKRIDEKKPYNLGWKPVIIQYHLTSWCSFGAGSTWLVNFEHCRWFSAWPTPIWLFFASIFVYNYSKYIIWFYFSITAFFATVSMAFFLHIFHFIILFSINYSQAFKQGHKQHFNDNYGALWAQKYFDIFVKMRILLCLWFFLIRILS